MAAPPSQDNIAFLPECFRTFLLDSMLRLLCGIMIVYECLCVRFHLIRSAFPQLNLVHQTKHSDTMAAEKGLSVKY